MKPVDKEPALHSKRDKATEEWPGGLQKTVPLGISRGERDKSGEEEKRHLKKTGKTSLFVLLARGKTNTEQRRGHWTKRVKRAL
jgi:hypothetical protein